MHKTQNKQFHTTRRGSQRSLFSHLQPEDRHKIVVGVLVHRQDASLLLGQLVKAMVSAQEGIARFRENCCRRPGADAIIREVMRLSLSDLLSLDTAVSLFINSWRRGRNFEILQMVFFSSKFVLVYNLFDILIAREVMMCVLISNLLIFISS